MTKRAVVTNILEINSIKKKLVQNLFFKTTKRKR